MKKIINYALEYYEKGINVLPIEANAKKPQIPHWKKYQNTPQIREEVEDMFASHEGNIAFVNGAGSGNLACLDIEEKGLFAEYCQEFLHQYGDTWMLKNRRGGHILFRTPKPLKNQGNVGNRGYEILGQGHYSLVPPSVFKDETGIYQYEYIRKPSEIITIQNVTFFDFKYLDIDNNYKENYKIIPGPSTPSQREWLIRRSILLIEEKNKNRKEEFSDSQFDFSIIATLANWEFEFDVIEEAFQRTNVPTKYSRICKKNKGRGKTYLYTSYEKASEQPDTDEYIELCEKTSHKASLLREEVEKNHFWWRGTAGRNDKNVLLAHIDKYEKCKKSPWNFSVREAAEKECATKSTVSRSNHRLITNGFLALSKKGNAGQSQSNSYEFGEKLISLLNGTYTIDNIVCTCPTSSIVDKDNHGVFENKALGKLCKEIYYAITRYGEMSIAEIANKILASHSAVRQRCKQMEELSILFSINRKYSINDKYDFKLLSDNLGIKEIKEERINKHNQDRYKQQELMSMRTLFYNYNEKIASGKLN